MIIASLNAFMEFDRVVEIHSDGTVTDAPGNLYAPDLCDGEIQDYRNRWEFFTTGYSGQHGYSGPIMHDSEYIGGGLERDLLSTPGIYVSVISSYTPDEEDDEDSEMILEGWAVLRYIG